MITQENDSYLKNLYLITLLIYVHLKLVNVDNIRQHVRLCYIFYKNIEFNDHKSINCKGRNARQFQWTPKIESMHEALYYELRVYINVNDT